MGCLERTEFAKNVILVASKMSSISCLFVLILGLREQYLPKYHTNNPNLRKFVYILHSNNGEIVRNLFLYIYKSLKMRNGAEKGS